MQNLYTIIPRELIEAIGWTIFHSLWQGLAITIALGIFLLVFSKFSAHIRYIITFSSLILMVIWSVFTFYKSYEDANERARIRERIVSNPQLVVEHLKENLARANTSIKNTANASTEFTIKWLMFKSKMQKQFPAVVFIWWLGLFLFLFRFMGGLIITKQMRYRGTIPVSEKWQTLTNDFNQKLKIKKSVILLQSCMAKVPLTIGYFKPVILLPISVYTGLTPSEIESIIAHELAHIARRDYFFNIIQSIIEILFFYHPAIWWISSLARTERENCCDDIAIELTGDSVNYAKALANIQEQVIANPDYAMAFSNNKNQLFRRVKRLLNPRTMKTNFKEGFIASSILITGILLIFLFTGASVKQDQSIKTRSKVPQDTLTLDNTTAVQPNETATEDPEQTDKEDINNKEERRLETLKSLENIELSEDLEKELEVALNDLDDITAEEVLRGVRGALYRMDLNLIVHKALKGAQAAVDNMDMNVIVKESLKDGDTCNEVDVDKITREAVKGASAALEEVDLNAIVHEVLKGVEGAINEIETQKRVNEAKDDEIGYYNHCDYSNRPTNKYYSKISRGPYRWNRWRSRNSDELPDLSNIYIYRHNLQEINFSKLPLKDAVIDDSDLRDADFSEVNAEDMLVREANLDGSNFENANLTDTRFSENIMDHCNFNNATLKDALFSGCTLKYCDFQKADLRNVTFIRCKIVKCRFKDAIANDNTVFPQGFNPEKHGIVIE